MINLTLLLYSQYLWERQALDIRQFIQHPGTKNSVRTQIKKEKKEPEELHSFRKFQNYILRNNGRVDALLAGRLFLLLL